MRPNCEIFLETAEKTVDLGVFIGKKLLRPSLIYLSGDLGTGKTYLSKGIANGLGFSEEITSPTFNLINEYHQDKISLYHLDLYRLNSVGEILDLGIEDFIDQPNSVVLVEWSERLENQKLSENLLEIYLDYQLPGRKIKIFSENFIYQELMEACREKFASSRH